MRDMNRVAGRRPSSPSLKNHTDRSQIYFTGGAAEARKVRNKNARRHEGKARMVGSGADTNDRPRCV